MKVLETLKSLHKQTLLKLKDIKRVVIAKQAGVDVEKYLSRAKTLEELLSSYSVIGTIEFKIGSLGVMTYYSEHDFIMPEGLTGGIIPVVSPSAQLENCYPSGSIVPKLTGIIIHGNEGSYTATTIESDVKSPEVNYLKGTLKQVTINEEGYRYYKYANGEHGLGFYFASEGGLLITNSANRAYLAVPINQEVADVYSITAEEATTMEGNANKSGNQVKTKTSTSSKTKSIKL